MSSNQLLYALVIIILGLGWAYRIIAQKPVVLPRTEHLKFVATLTQEPRIYDRYQVLAVGDGKVYTDLFPRYQVGDRLRFEGTADSSGKIYYPLIAKLGHQGRFGGIFGQLANKVSVNISKILPAREATLVSGTVLGVETIDREFRDQLIKTGTIHVVVVSGQNLTIVAGVFVALASYLGRRGSLILATAAVFLYALLTGFEPPVVRASLMVLASALAAYFGREASTLWTLILAALVIVFIWPRAILEISFQLTFAATLGIITLGQRLAKSWYRLPVVGQNAAIATSAYLFTAPLILFYFGQISPLSPLANLAVVEAIFPLMLLGFLMAAVSLIWLPLAQLIAYLAYPIAFYFTGVVKLFSALPIEPISLGGGGNLVFVLGFYILLLLMLVWSKRAKS